MRMISHQEIEQSGDAKTIFGTMKEEKRWYVAIVAPNTEAKAAEVLGVKYEVFLPAQQVVSVWKDGRSKLRNKILIPGKLLIHCTEHERLASCQHGYVKRYMVDIASMPNEFGRRRVAVVPDVQVQQLKCLLGQQNARVEMDNIGLHAGELVRVTHGAMKGLEGIVADWACDRPKLHIHIQHLGCASVEIDISNLERCK